MDIDNILAELLIFSTLHFFTKAIIIATAVLVVVPYIFGVISFEIAAIICMVVVFSLSVMLIYSLIGTIIRNT